MLKQFSGEKEKVANLLIKLANLQQNNILNLLLQVMKIALFIMNLSDWVGLIQCQMTAIIYCLIVILTIVKIVNFKIQMHKFHLMFMPIIVNASKVLICSQTYIIVQNLDVINIYVKAIKLLSI